jgi:hypothetical protein
MASATRAKNVFRRPAPWYRIVAIACFCFGGWVLMANIELTISRLTKEIQGERRFIKQA